LGFLGEICPHNTIDGKEGPLIATKIGGACQTTISECHDCDCQGIAVQVVYGAKHRRGNGSAETGRMNLRVGDETNKNVSTAG